MSASSPQSDKALTGATHASGTTRLAWRLFKRHRGRMIFFASCVAIGVGFLFAIGNILDTINDSIAGQARSLMTADVRVSSARPFSKKTKTLFQTLKKEGVRGTEMLNFASMLRPQGKGKTPVLVLVKAIQPNYPFYGKMEVAPASYRKSFFGQASCLISQELMEQQGLKLGDKVKLGRATLTIVGLLKKEPDQFFAGGLAPRVMVPRNIIQRTGLLQFGSRINYRMLLAVPDKAKGTPLALAKALKKRLDNTLNDPYLNITSYADAQPTLREAFQRAALFFIFVSLVALLLGAIGMAASVTAFLNEQLRNVGIFRCLGLTPRDVNRLYNRLCIGIGLLGGVLGTILGVGLSLLGQSALQKFWTLPLTPQLSWSHLAEGLLLSCVLTIGLNYLTVWSLSRLIPRDILGGQVQRIQLPRWGVGLTLVCLAIGFYLYAIQRANSVLYASFFTATLIGMIVLCLLLIMLGLWLLSLVSRFLGGGSGLIFAMRHGLRQLVRQRTRSLTFLLALTIGLTLISTLDLLQHSLITELRVGSGQSLPDLFLIDVQKDQVGGLRKLAKPYASKKIQFSPLVRARLTHLNGKAIQIGDTRNMTLEQRSRARFLTREYNLTYKDKLNSSETIIDGKFWREGEQKPVVSLEHRFAARIGAKVGDTMRFDIQGRSLDARVTSLRSINWTSLMPNFFVVLPRQVLEAAPQTLITSMALTKGASLKKFQQRLGKRYPNITTIKISQILERVQGLLMYLIIAMKMLAWVCVGVGLLILAGTLSMGRAERRSKIALLRTLGSDQRTIYWVDGFEFLGIGLLTGAIVLGVTVLMSLTITAQMNIQFHITTGHIVQIVVASLVLPLFVGFLSNRRTYSAGVMENLRV